MKRNHESNSKYKQKRSEGGLVLPRLMNYHYAAQVEFIVIMLNKELCPKWNNMEIKLVGTLNTLVFSKPIKQTTL